MLRRPSRRMARHNGARGNSRRGGPSNSARTRRRFGGCRRARNQTARSRLGARVMIRQLVTFFGLSRAVNGARGNGADGVRATWMGRPARVRLLGRSRIKRCEMDKRSAAHAENWEVRVNGPASWRTAKLAKRRPVKFSSLLKARWRRQRRPGSNPPLPPWHTPHDFVSYFLLPDS